MSPLDAESHALAGEYVLGVLEAEESRVIERRLQDDVAMKAAVAEWREKFAELDAAASVATVSPALWTRIERAVAEQASPAAASAVDRPSIRLWDNLRFWRLSGLASAAACIVLAVGMASLPGRPAPQPVVIAVLEAQDSTPGAIIEAFADGHIRLVPLTDIPVPPGRALQVWTLWDRDRGPVPLGLLGSAHRAVLNVDGQPVPRPQQLYEITLEPETGSPTGRPTGPVLYKGFAAAPR